MSALARFVLLGVSMFWGIGCTRPADPSKTDGPADHPKGTSPTEAAKKDTHKALPKEVLAAWQKAGAKVGWIRMEKGVPDFQTTDKSSQAGWLPVFVIEDYREGMLKGLPAPDTAFALDLFKTKITDAEFKRIAEFEHLVWLGLRSTKVTDAALKEIGKMNQLTTLDLNFTRVTDAGMKDVGRLSNLTFLSLTTTEITDAGVKEIARLKRLTFLSLYGTKVTDVGMKDVAQIQPLAELDLLNTAVTDRGLKELVGLKQLTKLILYRTKVTGAGVKELQQALPNCEIMI